MRHKVFLSLRQVKMISAYALVSQLTRKLAACSQGASRTWLLLGSLGANQLVDSYVKAPPSGAGR